MPESGASSRRSHSVQSRREGRRQVGRPSLGFVSVLLRLLRDYLRRYRGWLTAVVVLQLAGTIASLYLPSLNADIIDKGIALGDTGFIVRTGAWMLLISVVISVLAWLFRR